MSNLEETRKIRRDELEDTAISPPSVEEAVQVIEDAAAELKLPFSRWLIKLLVENAAKVISAAVIPAVTAAATAAGGWYVVGRYQVKDQVKEEVQTRDRVRDLVSDSMSPERLAGMRGPDGPPVSLPPTLDELRKRWKDRYDTSQPPPGVSDWDEDPKAQDAFPEELVRQELVRQAAAAEGR